MEDTSGLLLHFRIRALISIKGQCHAFRIRVLTSIKGQYHKHCGNCIVEQSAHRDKILSLKMSIVKKNFDNIFPQRQTISVQLETKEKTTGE